MVLGGASYSQLRMARASVLAVDGMARRGSALPHARLERMFAEHHSLVWRTLRRLGLSPVEAADTTRRVFQEASRRLGGASRAQERTKLLALTLRYAFSIDCFAVSEVRAVPQLAQREKVPPLEQREKFRSGVFVRAAASAPAAAQRAAPAPLASVDMMDRVLSHMPRPAATVFVLFELEGLALTEVAEVLSLGPEAVRQTLARARAEFKSIVAALAASPRQSSK